MKHTLTTFTILLISLSLSAQGIDFFEGTWDEAKELAKQERKLIFVDAYAKWCGPCKRMARTVFTDASVGDYYNDNFINLKIDMEEGMGLTFRKEYPVSAFPTLFYIDDKGEVVKKVVGGKGVPDFLKMGENIVKAYDRSGTYAERYEKGDRSYELVYEYVRALNDAQKPSQKIANDFLRNSTDLKKDERTRFLYEAMTSVDSRIYSLYLDDKANVIKLLGKEAFENKIEESAWRTVYSAIDFEVVDLVSEAKEKVAAQLPAERAQTFAERADYTYAQAVSDLPMMTTAALTLSKGSLKDDPEQLSDLADELQLYAALSPQIKSATMEIMSRTAKISDEPQYHIKYAELLAEHGETKKAIKTAKKALKKISPTKDEYQKLSDLIEELKRK